MMKKQKKVKKDMSKDLKPKNVKSRVRMLRVMRYKGYWVYARLIGTDLFLFDLSYNNEIYGGNLVITPRNGQTKLSELEIQRGTALIWASAIATIDTLLGEVYQGKNKDAAKAIIAVNEKQEAKAAMN